MTSVSRPTSPRTTRLPWPVSPSAEDGQAWSAASEATMGGAWTKLGAVLPGTVALAGLPARTGRTVSGWYSRLTRWIDGWHGSHDASAELAAQVVRLYEAGRYRDAEAAARRLVDWQRARLGERHPDVATSLANLGQVLQRQGDLAAAGPPLREALELRREALGESHPLYAASLLQLADLLLAQDDTKAAGPLFEQAIEALRGAVGESHADFASALTGHARLLHRRGALAEAEPLLRRALLVRREALGEHHPQYATALSNLALVLQQRGALEEAEDLCRQALETRRVVLGEGHPDHAASLEQLAGLLSRVDGAHSPIAARNGEASTDGPVPPSPQPPIDSAPSGGPSATEVDHPAPAAPIGPEEVAGPRPDSPRQRALAQLDQLDAVRPLDEAAAALLQRWAKDVSSARARILDAPTDDDLAADDLRIADGRSPLVALLRLAQAGPETPDAEWAGAYYLVADTYGEVVATAASRKRFQTP